MTSQQKIFEDMDRVVQNGWFKSLKTKFRLEKNILKTKILIFFKKQKKNNKQSLVVKSK